MMLNFLYFCWFVSLLTSLRNQANIRIYPVLNRNISENFQRYSYDVCKPEPFFLNFSDVCQSISWLTNKYNVHQHMYMFMTSYLELWPKKWPTIIGVKPVYTPKCPPFGLEIKTYFFINLIQFWVERWYYMSRLTPGSLRTDILNKMYIGWNWLKSSIQRADKSTSSKQRVDASTLIGCYQLQH